MNKLKSTFIRILVAALFVGLLPIADVFAQERVPQIRLSDIDDNSSILNDVYVKLYLARLRRARLGIERQKQELSTSMKKRDRAETLYTKQALSAEELEERRKEVEVASIAVQEAEAYAEEAQTFVDIAVSRISIGLEMPICAEIR